MVGAFFSLLLVIAFLSICGELFMRVRVAKRSSDKMAWWRGGGNEVSNSYEQLFPNSYLPLYRRFAFWLFVGSCAVVLVSLLWKSN